MWVVSAPRPGHPVRGSRTGVPIMALLDLLGRRWALRVIWELRSDPLTFRALQEQCAGMSSSVLNARLRELRDAGAVEVRPDGYALTAEEESCSRCTRGSMPGPSAGRGAAGPERPRPSVRSRPSRLLPLVPLAEVGVQLPHGLEQPAALEHGPRPRGWASSRGPPAGPRAPTSTSVAFTIAEPAGVGANGGDQWFIRKSDPVRPPRFGAQLAGQLRGR